MSNKFPKTITQTLYLHAEESSLPVDIHAVAAAGRYNRATPDHFWNNMIFDKQLGRFVDPNDPRVQAERDKRAGILADGESIRVSVSMMDGVPIRPTGPATPADVNAINAAYWG